MYAQYNASLKTCDDCAAACEHCAIACLQEADPKPMAPCIALSMDCAGICRLASAVIVRGSEFSKAICALCARICEECGNECAKHQFDHCQQCAEACRRCAKECRSTAS